jgi:NADPH-dependent 2,4-dienoyl-CoA reductase/sulfur reductase-like enzyme
VDMTLNVAGNGRGVWHDGAWLATNEHYGIGRHVLGAEDGVAHPGSTHAAAPRCAPLVGSGRHEAALQSIPCCSPACSQSPVRLPGCAHGYN